MLLLILISNQGIEIQPIDTPTTGCKACRYITALNTGQSMYIRKQVQNKQTCKEGGEKPASTHYNDYFAPCVCAHV